jgi:amidase
MPELLDKDAHEVSALIAAGLLSAEALMQATLDRVGAVNPAVNAIVSLRPAADLLAEARAADAVPARGALHGLPVAVKDLSDVAGLPTSMGSPALAGKVAVADDLIVARMRAAGAIVIGKTNTPEFGMGSHTFNPVFGATRNPYDLTRSAGGSSGGAAAALATGMVAISDGSDMMGSLRNPAGWNNVYGFRPGWGRVPSDPVGDSFLHQLTTAGPMARSPADIAVLLDVLSGPDPRQPHGIPHEMFAGRLDAPLGGRRIGWLGDWGGALPFEDGVLALCETALAGFEAMGCTVEPVAPPFSRDAIWEAWITLRSWSVAADLGALYDDPVIRDTLKPEAIWEIERGLALSAMQVHRASVIRSQWFTGAAHLFDHYDALALPTAQCWPFPVDWRWPDKIAGVAMDTYHRWMEVVVPCSLIGLPCLAVPAGFGAGGLPMGLQLIGRRGDDLELLQLGQGWHRCTDWPNRKPTPL